MVCNNSEKKILSLEIKPIYIIYMMIQSQLIRSLGIQAGLPGGLFVPVSQNFIQNIS